MSEIEEDDGDDLLECWADVLPARKPKAPPPTQEAPEVVVNAAGEVQGHILADHGPVYRMQATGPNGSVVVWLARGTPDFAGAQAPFAIVPGSVSGAPWHPTTIRDCGHGNESPNICPCPPTCHCKWYSCG